MQKSRQSATKIFKHFINISFVYYNMAGYIYIFLQNDKWKENYVIAIAFLRIFFSENSTIRSTQQLMLSILISQMKELGVIFYNCSCLVLDLQRIFALYSSLKFKSRVPQTWSKRLYGVYDNEKKLQLQLNETKSQAFVSVSYLPSSSSAPSPSSKGFVNWGCFSIILFCAKRE
jgi:hypothetical protein